MFFAQGLCICQIQDPCKQTKKSQNLDSETTLTHRSFVSRMFDSLKISILLASFNGRGILTRLVGQEKWNRVRKRILLRNRRECDLCLPQMSGIRGTKGPLHFPCSNQSELTLPSKSWSVGYGAWRVVLGITNTTIF
jgi:hypothetical protein